jgi:tetratricopeptide (TPR) repeat protein
LISRIGLAAFITSTLWAQIASVESRMPLPEDILARVRPVIDAVYRLDYPNAERLCRQLIQDASENPAGYVYLLRVYWSEQLSEARLLSAERLISMDLFAQKPRFRPPVSPQTIANLNAAANAALTKAANWVKAHPGDPTAQYLLGAIYEFMAGYQFTASHTLADASASANRAFKIHRDLALKYDMVDADVTTGAYSIIADGLDWFPKIVGWLLFGTRGNLAEGRRVLERAAQGGTIEAPDARLLLSVLYTRQKRFDDAKAVLDSLLKAYPENYLVHLDIAGVDLIANRPRLAIQTYRDILARNYSALERGVVLIRLGVASRMAGDLASSERWLREALESAASERSRALAHLELGKTLDLFGERGKALAEYQAALQVPDFLGLRQEARRWTGTPYDRVAMRQDPAGGGLISLSSH